MASAPRWRRVLPWAVAGVAVIGRRNDALVVGAVAAGCRPPSPLRVSAELGADASLVIAEAHRTTPIGNAAVVSPDGTQLAFVAQPHGGGAPRLYVRRLDQLTATPLAGTESAVGPFFSPDGQWLGFFGGGKLKKIAVTGGAPVTLADAPLARGGSWAEDGTIVFAPTSGERPVARAGGGRDSRAADDAGPRGSDAPVAAGAARRPGRPLHRERRASEISRTPGSPCSRCPPAPPHIVQRGGFYGRYLPSGHLTWVHDGTLFAAPFDLATLAITGPAVPVVSGVVSSTLSGSAQVDVSHTGTLVYLPGGENASAAPLDWLTRDGKTTPLRATPANWSGVQHRPERAPAGLLAHGRGEHGRVDVRCGARRADAVDVRSRRGSQSGLDAGWAAAGLQLLGEWRRAEPLLAAGGWQRGRHAADDQPEPTVSGVVAPERPLPGVSRKPAADRHRSADPAGRGRRGERVEAGYADRVSEMGRSRSSSRASRRTGGGWPTNRTSRAASRSTSGRFRDRGASGRSPRAAAPMPSGRARGMNCSTWRPTGGSWWCRIRPPATRFRPRSRASGARRWSSSGRYRGQLRSAPGRRARGDGAGHRGDGRPDARDAHVQLLRRAAAARAGEVSALVCLSPRPKDYSSLDREGTASSGFRLTWNRRNTFDGRLSRVNVGVDRGDSQERPSANPTSAAGRLYARSLDQMASSMV